MKDLSERLEESEEEGDGRNSQEDEGASIQALLPFFTICPSDNSFISHYVSRTLRPESRDVESK